MVGLQVATINGAKSTLGEATIDEFRCGLRGHLLQPGDTGYEEARKIWNANIDKHPTLIARCKGAADVIRAVNFARNNHVLVSVRGGGHSFPGASIADGGLVIDLTDMNSVRVDPVRRTARAEGGTKWGQFDRETQEFGLATTGGTNYDTGIAGLTLGGGHGWLGGKHALALDNLISVDIVTADGQLRVASATENSDLFWAVRGGGGNFGVVTSFEYQLHPVAELLVRLLFYPLKVAKKALQFYDEYVSNTPDEVNTAAGLATLQDGTPVVALIACYNGPLKDGEELMKPIQELGEPLVDQIGPMPYQEVQHILDNLTPDGKHYYEKAHFITQITDGAIDTLVDAYHDTSSPGNLLILQQQGNAANRVPQDAMAYSHRDAHYNLILIASWVDPGESEIHVKWTRDLWEALDPYSTGGVYVNNVGREVDEGPDMMRAAYGANYPRLVKLKNKYDPENLFRHNQNIKPTSSP